MRRSELYSEHDTRYGGTGKGLRKNAKDATLLYSGGYSIGIRGKGVFIGNLRTARYAQSTEIKKKDLEYLRIITDRQNIKYADNAWYL